MPATILSHQALVLPLKWRWPHRFSGIALCLGSMAPDLAFIARMSDDSVFSHTLAAQLWYTVPTTMGLVWLLTGLLLPTLLPYLRDHSWWQFHHLAALESPRGWRGWTSVAVSALIGGFSHVLIDGITHGNHTGWLVPYLPFLRTMVPHIGGPMPLHDVLQLWLTIVFALASALMWRVMVRRQLLWQWRGKTMTMLPRMPRAAGTGLLLLCGVAAIHGAVVGYQLRHSDSVKRLAAGVGFGMLDFALVALCLAATALRSRARRNPSRLPEPHRDPLGVSAVA